MSRRSPFLKPLPVSPPRACGQRRFHGPLPVGSLQAAQVRQTPSSESVPATPRVWRLSEPHSRRLASLDAFRGLAVAGMILVNNPGAWTDVYAPLQHATWNGCTAADLIFPFFLFTVGAAVTVSVGQRARHGAARHRLVWQILRRTALIFALGLFFNGFPLFDWSNLRIPGVLQRVALCYGLACFAVLALPIRGQVVALALLLLGYAAALRSGPFPAGPADLVGPEGNFVAYVDRQLLGGHLLHEGWDPEGLLSTLGATATTLLGAFAGYWVRSKNSPSRLAGGLLAGGTVALLLGLVLDRWLPINKSLWTPSFAIFTGGVALDAFALCYWLIDCRGYRAWATPFLVYGTNAIMAYMLSSLMAKTMLLWQVMGADGSKVSLQQYLFEHFFLRLAQPINASLLYALAYVLVWLGIAGLLYRQRVLIKI